MMRQAGSNSSHNGSIGRGMGSGESLSSLRPNTTINIVIFCFMTDTQFIGNLVE
jgi:hypothetical protein